MLTLTIPDMACAACATTITAAIHALDPTAIVTANPTTKVVTLQSSTDPAALKAAIAAAGYTVQ